MHDWGDNSLSDWVSHPERLKKLLKTISTTKLRNSIRGLCVVDENFDDEEFKKMLIEWDFKYISKFYIYIQIKDYLVYTCNYTFIIWFFRDDVIQQNNILRSFTFYCQNIFLL